MWKRRFARSRKALPMPSRACTATALSSRLGPPRGQRFPVPTPMRLDHVSRDFRRLVLLAAAVVARRQASRVRPRRLRGERTREEDRDGERTRHAPTDARAPATQPGPDGRPKLVAERLADRLLRRVRPARLRLDNPEPWREAAGSDARSLRPGHVGASRNIASPGPAFGNDPRARLVRRLRR
jgi:hypothetical protein